MARVLVGSWMVRYPMGGNLSWTLQWLLGFERLGHDVHLVEKSGYAGSCFDPVRMMMSDDCSYGTAVVDALLTRHNLKGRWCYVDERGNYHGHSPGRVRELFRTADVFVDIGTHGAWLGEAEHVGATVLVDGEPGYTQMKMEKRLAAGESVPEYDFYFSNGANIGRESCDAPTAGKEWRAVFNPVYTDLFSYVPPVADSRFTTVMNWQAHEPFRYRDKVYHQKDVEFEKFMGLPHATSAPLEVAVAGKFPRDRLIEHGWRIQEAHSVTTSFDSYQRYIYDSAGEFSVCKHGYVKLNTGWFSDRSAAYLAAGRPVVMQETGFSEFLPCGEGLFATHSVDDAAAAIDTIRCDPLRHSEAAREIAVEFLSTDRVLTRFLNEIGVS